MNADFAHLDLSQAAQYAVDAALLPSLMETFAGSLAKERIAIESLLSGDDGAAVRMSLHSLKGFVPILAGQAILIGDQAGIAILYERAGESADRFLALFVTSDRGQFASFDDYGRMEPFATNRSITERDDETDPNSSATLVFTDGDLLFLARADDVATLNEIRSDLGAP